MEEKKTGPETSSQEGHRILIVTRSMGRGLGKSSPGRIPISAAGNENGMFLFDRSVKFDEFDTFSLIEGMRSKQKESKRNQVAIALCFAHRNTIIMLVVFHRDVEWRLLCIDNKKFNDVHKCSNI